MADDDHEESIEEMALSIPPQLTIARGFMDLVLGAEPIGDTGLIVIDPNAQLQALIQAIVQLEVRVLRLEGVEIGE